MAYSTKTQVRSVTGMSDDTLISDTRVDQAIASADSLIDAYIGDAYVLPLDTVPDLIEQASMEIAGAKLYMDEYGEETQNLDKDWERKLNWWINEILVKIQERKLKLRDPSTQEELATSTLLNPTFYPNDVSEAAGDTTSYITVNKKY